MRSHKKAIWFLISIKLDTRVYCIDGGDIEFVFSFSLLFVVWLCIWGVVVGGGFFVVFVLYCCCFVFGFWVLGCFTGFSGGFVVVI